MERIATDNADNSHFLAMWAFATELAGERVRAIELARRAVDLNPDTPWAHHAWAHALLRDGRPGEGIAAIGGYLESWSRFARAIESHNAWHLALFHWLELDLDAAWSLYRKYIWNAAAETTGERLDIISFLWRLELAGATIAPDDWQAIAERVLPHVGECAIPFNAAHYAYALCRAGRDDESRQLRECVGAFAARQMGDRAKAWQGAGVPLVDASIAMARGDAASACVLLDPVVGEIGRVGGSDAQDDLFRYAHLVALIDAGRKGAARTMLDDMLSGRAPTPLEDRWLRRL
jgi:tetratricopeptide (TPR) repeat protein